jgi:hypothetical protein
MANGRPGQVGSGWVASLSHQLEPCTYLLGTACQTVLPLQAYPAYAFVDMPVWETFRIMMLTPCCVICQMPETALLLHMTVNCAHVPTKRWSARSHGMHTPRCFVCLVFASCPCEHMCVCSLHFAVAGMILRKTDGRWIEVWLMSHHYWSSE